MLNAFDALDLFENLKKSFTEEQAGALSRTFSSVFDEKAASKRDLHEMEMQIEAKLSEMDRKLKELELNIKREMGVLELGLNARINELSLRLEAKLAEVRTEIAAGKNDVIRWTIGLLLAQSGFLLGAVKFLH